MRALVVCLLLVATGCKDKDAGEQAPPSRAEKSEADRAAMEKAQADAEQAVKEAKEAQEAVVRLEQEATDLQKRITDSTDAVVGAQSQADRDAANAKLESLQREKAELDARLAAVKAKAAHEGGTISQECLENPLAKGCR